MPEDKTKRTGQEVQKSPRLSEEGTIKKESDRGVTARGETPTGHTPGEQPCCCNRIRVLLEKVECVHVTAAFGFITATSDEIAITSIVQESGHAPTGAKWPEMQDTYPLDNGESTDEDLGFVLGILQPNIPCKIDAEVAITVWKINVFSDLKSPLQEVLGKAALVGQSMTGVASLGQMMDALLNRLYHAAGIGKTVVGDSIRLHFHIPNFCCEKSLIDHLKPGMGNKLKPDGDDACTLERTVKGNKGSYKISLRFERECDARKPK